MSQLGSVFYSGTGCGASYRGVPLGTGFSGEMGQFEYAMSNREAAVVGLMVQALASLAVPTAVREAGGHSADVMLWPVDIAEAYAAINVPVGITLIQLMYRSNASSWSSGRSLVAVLTVENPDVVALIPRWESVFGSGGDGAPSGIKDLRGCVHPGNFAAFCDKFARVAGKYKVEPDAKNWVAWSRLYYAPEAPTVARTILFSGDGEYVASNSWEALRDVLGGKEPYVGADYWGALKVMALAHAGMPRITSAELRATVDSKWPVTVGMLRQRVCSAGEPPKLAATSFFEGSEPVRTLTMGGEIANDNRDEADTQLTEDELARDFAKAANLSVPDEVYGEGCQSGTGSESEVTLEAASPHDTAGGCVKGCPLLGCSGKDPGTWGRSDKATVLATFLRAASYLPTHGGEFTGAPVQYIGREDARNIAEGFSSLIGVPVKGGTLYEIWYPSGKRRPVTSLADFMVAWAELKDGSIPFSCVPRDPFELWRPLHEAGCTIHAGVGSDAGSIYCQRPLGAEAIVAMLTDAGARVRDVGTSVSGLAIFRSITVHLGHAWQQRGGMCGLDLQVECMVRGPPVGDGHTSALGRGLVIGDANYADDRHIGTLQGTWQPYKPDSVSRKAADVSEPAVVTRGPKKKKKKSKEGGFGTTNTADGDGKTGRQKRRDKQRAKKKGAVGPSSSAINVPEPASTQTPARAVT